jgi:hypothetical protein
MHMYTVAPLLRCRQFSDFFFLFRGVIQCTYISNMERCKNDLKLIEVCLRIKRGGTVYSVQQFSSDLTIREPNPGGRARYSVSVQIVPDNHQPPVQWVSVPSGGEGGRRVGVVLTTHPL